MRKLYSVVIVLVLVSCRTNEFKHYSLKRSFSGISYSFNGYGIPNKDSLKSFTSYISYDSSTKSYHSVLFAKNGQIDEIIATNYLNCYIGGEHIVKFRNGKLYTFFMLDSNCNVNGPVFIYNKRGKLDYICVYNQGYYDCQMYSRTGKVYKDTFRFSRFIYHKF